MEVEEEKEEEEEEEEEVVKRGGGQMKSPCAGLSYLSRWAHPQGESRAISSRSEY